MKRRPLLSLLLRCSLSWFGDRTKGPFAAVRESLGGPLRQTRRATIRSDQVRTGHAIGTVDPPPLTRSCPRPFNCFALLNLYWITSSARSKIDCGTVRPSALAVLRLTTISNFVGN